MGYSESVKLMKSAMTMELNAKYDEVQKRNIRAYSEIVDEPLQRIRPEIQLYAAEYTLRGMYPAVFKRAASARVYAEIERALSQLTAEGLPMGKRNWSHELKRRVADRYVDEKMSREIKQVQSRFYWLMITTIVTVLSGVFAHFQLKSR
ncbi:hypothetical protein SARC_08405 [Sphaeroforma arctica JP610]|uniref:Uncharacterized protein n=1 Tax=Sphaeroforma arctica JP610 TaxID=667725 RepID=A0A0L0FT97_9EUKA|nr:hypothetical protein SARC_08405 [Sphaeroforma arctica JP610]KNC79193.1 hypothetical protein SARC_08405 [Sphaeroforma arctica JP610]|eukprot:XP_014153095.1 hypothetical protein SARC_08405 [Sphaeroforma arctica JP610]